MCRTGSFLHSVPFSGSGSTWHIWMTTHSSLVPSWYLCCHDGLTSLTWVVNVSGMAVPLSCTDTIRHIWRSKSLDNCLYPEGYCSSNNSIYQRIVCSRTTRGGTYHGTYWCSCHHPPPPVCVLFSSTRVLDVYFVISDVDMADSNLS